LEYEIDLPDLEDVVPEEENGEIETSLTGVPQGQMTTATTTAVLHEPTEVVTAELISEEQVNEILAQVKAPR
jgi:hypothetical protein